MTGPTLLEIEHGIQKEKTINLIAQQLYLEEIHKEKEEHLNN
jgi:hypothetical protein